MTKRAERKLDFSQKAFVKRGWIVGRGSPLSLEWYMHGKLGSVPSKQYSPGHYRHLAGNAARRPRLAHGGEDHQGGGGAYKAQFFSIDQPGQPFPATRSRSMDRPLK